MKKKTKKTPKGIGMMDSIAFEEQRKKQTPLYELTLTLGDKVYKGSGTTLLEALRSMPRPNKIVTKGVLLVTSGERKAERDFFMLQTKRLFYPIAQTYWAKQLEFLLK